METHKKKRKGRVVISDVAKASGASKTTVSFVLNNTPGKSISRATRQRVLKTAYDLGYQPNTYAQALGRGYTNEIAHVFFEPVQSFYSERWIEPVQNRARELGYTVGVYVYRGTSKQAIKEMIDNVLSRIPAGVLTTKTCFTKEDYKRAKKLGVRACVLLDIEQANYAPTIVTPVQEVGELLGTHFLERGHRRIASVAPIMPTPRDHVVWLGYTKGLHSVLDQGDVRLSKLSMAPTLDSARAAVDRLLSSRKRPTAVVGFMATYSFLLLKALLERGVRVPEDVAVATMEDTDLCNLVHPALTSVSFDLKTVVMHQVDIADALIRGCEPDPEWFVCPPPQLIVRESS